METIDRFCHNLIVWTHYTLVLCGIIFVAEFAYDKYRFYFPTQLEQLADATFNAATKEWRK